MKHALVTGGAGFIGSHLVDSLLLDGWHVTVLDNFDSYYDPAIKRRNIAEHLKNPAYSLCEADIRDISELRSCSLGSYDAIVHLAARVGVRPSLADPLGYQDTNVCGTQHMLELARDWGVKQFVCASSSSVYGVNANVPWSEEDHVLLPISPYASTKVSCELLGHVYSYLYGIRFVALRFFTVYGPRQRPDLAIHKFARRILSGEPIPVYGDGSTRRDYTFVADIVQGIRSAMTYEKSQYDVFNLGNHHTITLREMIGEIERVLNVKADCRWMPEQPGDVPQTYADISKAQQELGYHPRTDFPEGIERFAEWLGDEIQESKVRSQELEVTSKE